MTDWLQQIYWGNTVKAYLIAIGIIVIGFIILRIIRTIVLRKLQRVAKKTESDIDDVLMRIINRGVLPLLYLGLIYSAVMTLNLSPFLSKALHVAMVVILVFFVVRMIIAVVDFALGFYLQKQGRPEAKAGLSGVMVIIQVVLWVFGLVFLLGNLGYNIVTILTGLGIGGIAVALAAQNILADIFAYFSILFDRPFDVGDFLIIEGQLGTVTHIGIKTTRIQSLWGEELSYSNKNMLNQWIHNYSRMDKRRAVFGLNVSYNTPAGKLEQIPEEVKKIILAQDNVSLDRVHFFEFREYYIYFEAVYYSLNPDYGVYRDIQQKINLAICRKFEEMGVKFAFSTDRAVYMQNGSHSNSHDDRISQTEDQGNRPQPGRS